MEKQNKVVLAIGAHADDIELGCAGTLIRLKEEGFEIYGLLLTDSGGRITQDKEEREKYVAIRKEEAKSSARLLGFDERPDLDLFDEVLFFANLQDTTVEHDVKTIDPIRKIFSGINPSIVFVHNAHDTHSDHQQSMLSTVSAIRKEAIILKYEIYVSDHPSFKPDIYADITESLEGKIEALKCFKSQIPKPIDLHEVREVAKKRGEEVGVEYAEVFKMEEFKSYTDILSIPSQVFVRHPLWDPFVKDGASLVLPIPTLYTGPDVIHGVQTPLDCLELKVPNIRQAREYWEKRGKFRTKGELLKRASSDEEKEEIERFYPHLKENQVVPYYIIPHSGYTGIGDARGLAEVMSNILRLNPDLIAGGYPRLEVVTADTAIADNHIYDKNLIVFGGGGSNKVTAHFDDFLDRIYPFQRYHHTSRVHGDIDGAGNKIGDYFPQTGNIPGQDCASLVFLRPNALGKGIPGGHVLIFDGYEAAGTLAACYVVTRPQLEKILQQFSDFIRDHDYLVVQLEIQVKKVMYGQPIVDQIELVECTLVGFS